MGREVKQVKIGGRKRGEDGERGETGKERGMERGEGEKRAIKKERSKKLEGLDSKFSCSVIILISM